MAIHQVDIIQEYYLKHLNYCSYLFIIKYCYLFIGPGFIPPPGVPPYGEAPPPVNPEFGGVPPGQPGMYGSSYGEDPMQDEIKGFEFNDKTIRNGFIR